MSASATVKAAARSLRVTAPWVVAAAILALLLRNTPREALLSSLRQGPTVALALFALFHTGASLLGDAWATQRTLALTGFHLPLRRTLLLRGATYLPGLLHYALGQGGLAYYLHREGDPGIRSTGRVLFLLYVNFLALGLIGLIGLSLVPRTPSDGAPESWLLAGGLATLAVLVLLSLSWKRLARYPLLAPLATVGPRGHLAALAYRLPHVAILALGHWIALRIWGIPVPLGPGLAGVSVVLLVAALPIVPVGLGTVQAAQVLLFSSFVPALPGSQKGAVVLAFGLAYQLLALASQALFGAICLSRLRPPRLPRTEGEA